MQPEETNIGREQRAADNYRQLFGEVCFVGDLDDKTRELITVVLLAVNQTLPQLRAHTAAALNVGLTALEDRSLEKQLTALMHCFPYLGFPRALNAIRKVQEAAG